MTRINLVLLWLLLLLFKPAILDGKHSSASNHGEGDCYLPILLREESSTNTNYRKLEESLMVYFNPKRGHFYFDQNDISFIFYEVVIEIKDGNRTTVVEGLNHLELLDSDGLHNTLDSLIRKMSLMRPIVFPFK